MQQISRIAADLCIGYSLGALLLLKSSWQLTDKPGILIAGFPDLRKESNRGGCFPVEEIKTIQRNLGRHPLRTLNHFYRHFGLSLSCQSIDDYDLDELNWGLDFLAKESMMQPFQMDNFYAYLGGRRSTHRFGSPSQNNFLIRKHFPARVIVCVIICRI